MAVYSTTRLDLVSQVRTELSEPIEAFFLNAEIVVWLNKAQLEICTIAEALKKTVTVNLDGSANYALPADFHKEIRIRYKTGGSEFRNLEWMPNDRYLSFRTITTSSFPTHYTIVGNDLYIYPTPTSTTDTFDHYYIALPQALDLDTSVPFNGEDRLTPYHELLVLYAAGKGKLNEGESEEGAVRMSAYYSGMQNMKHALRQPRKAGAYSFGETMGDYKPATVRLPSTYEG